LTGATKIQKGTWYLLKKIISRWRQIELDHFHPESDPEISSENPINPVRENKKKILSKGNYGILRNNP